MKVVTRILLNAHMLATARSLVPKSLSFSDDAKNGIRSHGFLRATSALVLVTFTTMTLQPLTVAAQIKRLEAQEKSGQLEKKEDTLDDALNQVEETLKRIVPDAFPRPVLATTQSGNVTGAPSNQQSAANAHSPPTKKEVVSAVSPDDLVAAADRIIDAQTVLESQADIVLADFNETEVRLKHQNAPALMLMRHAEAVRQFTERRAEMIRLVKSISDQRPTKSILPLKKRIAPQENAPAHQSLKDSLSGLAKFMAKYPNKRGHSYVDPNNLPLRMPSGNVRPAAETRRGLLAALGQQPALLAGAIPAGGMQITQASLSANTPPSAADLAATEDVQITQAIRDKASELNHHPVAIANWVKNNIEFLPTYGSIQGSDLTLLSKRGNAFDTASLLIALYRAANIPARYVYGTVELPAEQVMNWVGGVTTPEAAQSLLGQGGIPTAAVISAGRIKSFRIEHAWVETYVSYHPGRGAKHITGQGDTWVPVDASFKQYIYTDGMDVKANVPFNAQIFFEQAKVGATVNEAEGWVQNLNQVNIQSQLASYQHQIISYVTSQKPNATVGDLLGNKIIIQSNPAILTGLAYTVKATSNRYSDLPSALRHKFEFKFYASEVEKAGDAPTFTISKSLASIAGKKLALTYDPTTADDAKIIRDAADSYQTSFPAYLVKMTPKLKLEGQTIASGGSIGVGHSQAIRVNVVTPWYSQSRDYNLSSGDLSVFGINAAGTTHAQWNQRTASNNLAIGSHPDFIAEMFYQIVTGWWGQKFAFNDIIGATNGVLSYQLPSHAIAGSPVTTSYFLGVPRYATYQRRILDGKEDFVVAEHRQSDQEKRKQYALTIGQVGSYLEAAIYEQAFLMKPGFSMSTMTALKAAADKGIRTYVITQANVGAVLPLMQTDANTKEDIRNAVASGKRVTASQNDITIAGFTGIGYVVEDPQTGAGAYLISGGKNGGDSPSHENVFPTPQIPFSPVIGLMLASNLRDVNAKIAVENGQIVGIVFPATLQFVGAAAGAAAGAAILLLIYLFYILLKKFLEDALNNRRPRDDQPKKVYRYYTTGDTLDKVSKGYVIWASMGPPEGPLPPAGPTFGTGVYVTAHDEPINQGVRCPMTYEQRLFIVTQLQIPRPGRENPDSIDGWLEIEQTIEGLPVVVESGPDLVNSRGVQESVIRSPLVPVPANVGRKMLVLDRPNLGITTGFKAVKSCPEYSF